MAALHRAVKSAAAEKLTDMHPRSARNWLWLRTAQLRAGRHKPLALHFAELAEAVDQAGGILFLPSRTHGKRLWRTCRRHAQRLLDQLLAWGLVALSEEGGGRMANGEGRAHAVILTELGQQVWADPRQWPQNARECPTINAGGPAAGEAPPQLLAPLGAADVKGDTIAPQTPVGFSFNDSGPLPDRRCDSAAGTGTPQSATSSAPSHVPAGPAAPPLCAPAGALTDVDDTPTAPVDGRASFVPSVVDKLKRLRQSGRLPHKPGNVVGKQAHDDILRTIVQPSTVQLAEGGVAFARSWAERALASLVVALGTAWAPPHLVTRAIDDVAAEVEAGRRVVSPGRLAAHKLLAALEREKAQKVSPATGAGYELTKKPKGLVNQAVAAQDERHGPFRWTEGCSCAGCAWAREYRGVTT